MDSEQYTQILHELEGIRLDMRILPVLEHRIKDNERAISQVGTKLEDVDKGGTRGMILYVEKSIEAARMQAQVYRSRIWVALIGGFALVAAALITAFVR
jgi:hypothetical protein